MTTLICSCQNATRFGEKIKRTLYQASAFNGYPAVSKNHCLKNLSDFHKFSSAFFVMLGVSFSVYFKTSSVYYLMRGTRIYKIHLPMTKNFKSTNLKFNETVFSYKTRYNYFSSFINYYNLRHLFFLYYCFEPRLWRHN